MRAATFFTLLFLFAACLTVLAGTPHGKALDRRLNCYDSIQQAPHMCLDFVYGLMKCLKHCPSLISCFYQYECNEYLAICTVTISAVSETELGNDRSE